MANSTLSQARRRTTKAESLTGRVVAYLRQSLDDVGDEFAVGRQRKIIERLAKDLGLVVAEWFIDNNTSAYSDRKRPNFERLLMQMNDGQVGVLLAYDSRRVCRKLPDLDRLMTAALVGGTEIRTAKSGDIDIVTADGRMISRILGSIAQGESEKFAERMMDRNDQKADLGEPHGGGKPPYGYLYVDRTYVPHPEEAPVLLGIIAEVKAGRSLYAITQRLNNEGVPTRERANQAAQWRAEIVKGVVLNPQIAGQRVLRGDVVGVGNWPALITIDEHHDLAAILSRPARAGSGVHRKYLLSGLVRNKVGEPMKGRKIIVRSAAGGERIAYSTGNPVQVSCAIDADELDETVTEAFLRRIESAVVPKPAKQGPGAATTLQALEAQKSDLAAMHARGEIDKGEWLAMRQALVERVEAARQALTSTHRPPNLEALFAGEGTIRERFAQLDLDAKRACLVEAIEVVVVGNGVRGGPRVPLADRLDPTEGLGPKWLI